MSTQHLYNLAALATGIAKAKESVFVRTLAAMEGPAWVYYAQVSKGREHCYYLGYTSRDPESRCKELVRPSLRSVYTVQLLDKLKCASTLEAYERKRWLVEQIDRYREQHKVPYVTTTWKYAVTAAPELHSFNILEIGPAILHTERE
jgi:hypothetical protein